MDYICFNGNFLPADEPVVTSQNRGLRYGDGVFETIKLVKGTLLFEQFHYDRLLLGLKMLQIEWTVPTSNLSSQILELCKKNNCMDLARIRLAVFRGEQSKAEFIIEAFPLSGKINQWNEKGMVIDLYPYARKNADAFSNLKTANFLPYVLAELFARQKGIDDAVVLNAFNTIADSSKANIFLIRNDDIFTPALHQGCVSGVMRRFFFDQLKRHGYRVHQQEIPEQLLLDADEVFLTNCIFDMRWVGQFRKKNYPGEQSFSIYQKLISPLYQFT